MLSWIKVSSYTDTKECLFCVQYRNIMDGGDRMFSQENCEQGHNTDTWNELLKW